MATSHTTRRYVTFGNLLSIHLANANMQQKDLAQKSREELDRPRYYTSHTEFIGRQEDINIIIASLLNIFQNPHPQTRIVTLVGLPGVGKTELAEQIIACDPIKKHFSTISIFLNNKK